MFEWLINLPVIVQTPLVVVCALVVCLAFAAVFHALLWRVVRPTDEERKVAGYGEDGSILKKLLLMTDRDEVTLNEIESSAINGAGGLSSPDEDHSQAGASDQPEASENGQVEVSDSPRRNGRTEARSEVAASGSSELKPRSELKSPSESNSQNENEEPVR